MGLTNIEQILNLHCDHVVNHSNPVFSQDNDDDDCTIKISSTAESHILIDGSLTVTLTLNTANQSFTMTLALGLKMMHHHIRFGYQKSSAVQKISGQKVVKLLDLGCDLVLKHSNPNLSQCFAL